MLWREYHCLFPPPPLRSYPPRPPFLGPPDWNDLALIPWLDFADHSPFRPNARWHLDSACVSLVPSDEVAPGDPLLISYGLKPNSELLFHYGFVVEDGPCDRVGLPLGDLTPMQQVPSLSLTAFVSPGACLHLLSQYPVPRPLSPWIGCRLCGCSPVPCGALLCFACLGRAQGLLQALGLTSPVLQVWVPGPVSDHTPVPGSGCDDSSGAGGGGGGAGGGGSGAGGGGGGAGGDGGAGAGASPGAPAGAEADAGDEAGTQVCEDGYLVGVVRGLVQGREGPSGEPLSGPGPDGLVVLRVCEGGPDATLVADVDAMVQGDGGGDVVTVGMVRALRRMVKGALERLHGGHDDAPPSTASSDLGTGTREEPEPEHEGVKAPAPAHVLAAVTAYRALYTGALDRIARLLG